MHTQPIQPPPCDVGPKPAVLPLSLYAQENRAHRRTLWTGEHLQLAVLCLSPGEDMGTEMHPALDRLLCVEEGYALLRYGRCRSTISDSGYMKRGDAFLVPAGTYHNLVNVGKRALRLSSVCAPPHLSHGAVYPTKEDELKTKL